MKNELKGIGKGLLIGLILAVGVSVFAAWSEPTSAPTAGNADAPINVSNSTQTKGGNLVVNNNNQGVNGLIVPFGNVLIGISTYPSNLKLNVGSGIGATQYCDNTGANCFKSA